MIKPIANDELIEKLSDKQKIAMLKLERDYLISMVNLACVDSFEGTIKRVHIFVEFAKNMKMVMLGNELPKTYAAEMKQNDFNHIFNDRNSPVTIVTSK